jgi:hypothetical protein
MTTYYKCVSVDEIKHQEYATIFIVLIGGKIPMMAQWRPCEGSERGNGIGKWFSMGMSEAKEIPKGVTHFLLPVPVPESVEVCKLTKEEFESIAKSAVEEYLIGQAVGKSMTETEKLLLSKFTLLLADKEREITELKKEIEKLKLK